MCLLNCSISVSLEGQDAISVQRIQGDMISHTINNASMAGNVGGWQMQFDRRLNEDPSKHLSPRFVGLTLYGFDMGDARRASAYRDTFGPNNDGLYAKGGKVIAVSGVVGQAIQLNQKWDFHYQWATGVSYHTAYFDAVKNPRNLAISTRINFTGQLRIDLMRQLGNRSQCQLGMGITHFSNANYRKPNVGYNIVQGSIAWRYQLNQIRDKQFSHRCCQMVNTKKKQMALRGGYRMFTLIQPDYFPVVVGEWNHKFSFGQNGKKAESKLHEWRYGVNVFYEFPHGEITKKMEVGTFARHVFRMGMFDLMLDLGMYLHRPQSNKTQFYNCLGFQCHISDHWIFQQRLKAHLNNADYLEWGLVYNL